MSIPSEFYRLLNNMLRAGKVFAVDYPNARVRVTDGKGWESGWLPWLVTRAGDDVMWHPLSIGEQVLVMCPGGDPAQGVVAGALYSRVHPSPSQSPDTPTQRFRDGSVLVQDKKQGSITLRVPGTLTIDAYKVVIQADIEQQGTHTSSGDQVAAGISQVGHTHREQGDGKLVGPAQ